MDAKNETLKMLCTGMAFGVVQDLPVKGKFNFLQNIRVLTNGELVARPSLIPFITFNVASTGAVPHSIKLITNKVNTTFNRIIGMDTRIFSTINSTSIIVVDGVPYISYILDVKDTGYSGKPLCIFDFRPEAAIQAYAYIADENKFVKISVDNILTDVGIVAPNDAATWKIGAPERKVIDAIETGAIANWNNLTGSAGVPTLPSRINTTTLIATIADGALPNFINVVPTTFTSNIQRGTVVYIDGTEYIIEDVLSSSLNTGVATIAKISYDVGVAGKATIVLNISSPDIQRNSILLLNGTEYVRVEDVTFDDNGIPSIRTTTVGTFAVGNTVSGISSFRVYSAVSYAAAKTILASYLQTVIGASGVSSITRTFNVDLLNTSARALTMDDIFHTSLKTNNPTLINEVQIQLDVTAGAGTWQDYFLHAINPSFFTATAAQTTPTLSVIQQAIQRRNLIAQQNRALFDRFGRAGDLESFDETFPLASLTEATLGNDAWTELEIPLSGFTRVGADESRTLKDVKAIRISVNASAGVTVAIDSLWVGGANALSSHNQGFLAYNYVWRIRNPDTKEPSNWSPPLRTGIRISRGKVVLSFPNANVLYPVTYKIDIARYGGTLNDFRIIGSILNNGTSYTDNSSDSLVADNELAGRLEGNVDAVFDFFKPFAVLDTPKKGTCDVIGTKWVWVSGDKLNISYPRGTLIVINGKANKFYNSPVSTGAANAATSVELEDDMGNLAGVTFEIEDPLLTGQPLPMVFGPFGEGNLGNFFFGLGYKGAAGTLYWLDGNSPGTQSDLNSLEITSPSEPLLAGVMYDGLPYVWTNEKSFQIIPTYVDNQFSFIARENANSRGVFSRYAIVSARDYIYYLTENADGIVRVQGNGNPQYITEGISNLFYNSGKVPGPITLLDGTIIYPPNYVLVNDLRFFAVKDYVFFRFIDTDPVHPDHHCIVFDEKLNDWISYDAYINNRINAFYFEEVESNSRIIAGIPDGVAIFGVGGNYENLERTKIIPFAFDGGDSNFVKEFKEEVTSADEGINGFTIRNYYNNGETSDPLITIPGTITRSRKRFISNLQDVAGAGKLGRNITSIFTWLITSGTKLYEQIYYWIPKADEITNRSSDVEDGGTLGEKLWQGVVIKCNTFGLDKLLNYYNDEGILKATVTVNCNGEHTIAKSFDQPFISHTIQRSSADNIAWIPIEEVYVFDIEPEAANVWEGEFNTNDLTGLITFKRMAIAYRSDADSFIKLFFDDGTTQQYSLPNSAGEWHKEFFYVQAKKWKACKYRIESEGTIRPYKRHCEVWMRSYNSNQGFTKATPFGGDSNITDIKI